MAHDESETAEERRRALVKVAEYLAELLRDEPYRADWLVYARRPRPGQISQAAVAQVVANYLWDTGLADEHDRNLPRELKDRIGRALRGEVLTPETLSWLIHAFGLDEDETAELWARYGAAIAERPDAHDEPGYRTISLHEFHYLGEDGLPERHRTVHVVKALRDGVTSYPYLFDTATAEVTVERGGTAGPVCPREDGLHGVDIQFHHPLRLGQTASFEYQTLFRYRAPPPPEFRREARGLIENMELRVQFHPRKLPRGVCWAQWAGRAGPIIQREHVTLDPDHAVQRYVTSVRGKVLGFVWER